MIHEKIVSRNKQSIESIKSESSSRLMIANDRASIIFIEIFDDESENARTFYHVRNIDQLKYWLNKDENVLIKTWMNIHDKSIFVMNKYNKKMMKFDEFTEKYNDWLNELNDAKLIIRELKVELRERDVENNLRNSNTSLSTTEREVLIVTFKKLSDSSIFTDDKNSFIDDWLSAMQK
jgi:uncharacterized protein YeaO (DUF488 family)